MPSRREHSRRLTRRTFTAAAALSVAAGLAGCDRENGDRGTVAFADSPPASTVLPGQDLAAAALTLSSLFVASSDVVVIATDQNAAELAGLLTETPLPLLIGTGSAVAEEVERLGADTAVIAAGTELGDLDDTLRTIELDLTAEDPRADLPTVRTDPAPPPAALLVDPEAQAPAQAFAAALMSAYGSTVTDVPGGDPRHSAESVAAVREAAGDDPAAGVLALGETFGPPDAWASTLGSVLTAPELPGGGQLAFPGRRMIAAYGSPGTPSLGILGEQPLEEAITRVQQLAADYEHLTEEPVIPAFEVISTVASASAGGDGDYSHELDPELLREWVDAAGEAGVYVVLDLQPGHTDFLTQAKLYEDLLTAPHVGLALDPEWRLAPGQKHMVQIGSVSAAEVNEVSTWLADLTRDHGLPQKVLILHQFNLRMISDRQDLDTSRTELAITLHADGHGVPGDKMATWEALQTDLPEGIFMAWKNFYDEDTPTFTPEETYAVQPRPWFVSYQ